MIESSFNPQELVRSLSQAATGATDDFELGSFLRRRIFYSGVGKTVEQCERAEITREASGGLIEGLAGLTGEKKSGM